MVKLGEIGTIVTGNTPSTRVAEFFENSDIPFYKPSDLSETSVISVKKSTTYLDNRAKNKIRLIPSGSVLVTCIGIIGKVAVSNNKECATNQQINAIIPKKEICDSKYLAYAIFSLQQYLQDKANAPVVPIINKKDFSAIEIPLPPIDEQKRIAEELDKISELIAKRKSQLQKLDLLVKAKFVEMFGDPVTNPMGWKEEGLGVLGELNRGVSKHRPRNAPKLLGGKYPLIQTGEVSKAILYITDYSNTYSELGLQQSRMWKKETLCITIAANIAKTAILCFDACFPDSIVGFASGDKTNQIFIHYWFSFFQQLLEAQAPESAQKNINLKILNELQVISPPFPLQNRFADYVAKVEQTKTKLQQGLEQVETLYKARMQKYFE